jgi:hypothetical protein
MEFVQGETLASRLKKGRLDLDQTLQYAVQIAGALEEAHLNGVTHRDLKPDNIMITKSGVKLLDFGLAKLRNDTGAASAMPHVSTQDLTAQGTILGTLPYMAPEQLEGKDADARTDIFAFGAIAYEMVTGKRAFHGKSQASLIAAIMNQDPQPMERGRSPLDRLVRKCLAKNPNDRWQTAADLRREVTKLTSTTHSAGYIRQKIRFDKRFVFLSSIFLAVMGVVINAHVSGDPWIIGYFVGTLLVSVFLSAVLVLFQGQNQKHIAFAAFFLFAALITGAVWWRHIDIQHFVSDPIGFQRPMSFCYGHHGFIPYLLLLGNWATFMVYMTHSYTREDFNKQNQKPLLIALSIFLVYLFGCRLVWEKVESDALQRLREHPSIELNCPEPERARA